MKLFDAEIVFRGHHDKLADQLSDGILKHYLENNSQADINVDVVGGEGTVFIKGNVNNSNSLDITSPIKNVLRDLNYDTDILILDETSQCEIFNHDDATVYGYATNETSLYLSKTMLILQDIAREYDLLCKQNPIFLQDGKAKMTGVYKDDKLMQIRSININHQNTGGNRELIYATIVNLVKKVCKKYEVKIDDIKVNPNGDYKKGGFDRDTGLTGSKPEIDSYQGLCTSTNFVMSGKSIYGMRAGVYWARELAKRILIEQNCDWCEVKAEYSEDAIVPYEITITTNKGDIEVNKSTYEDFEPSRVVKCLDLVNKNYVELASYGQIQE